MSILVIGAAPDYALLYVARFREALSHTSDRTTAVLTAWKASFEPILASGATVILALLAAGILCALFGALTLLLTVSAGLLQLKANGVPQTDVILSASNAVDGQDALARHFDAGSGSPAVIVAAERAAEEVLDKVEAANGVGRLPSGRG